MPLPVPVSSLWLCHAFDHQHKGRKEGRKEGCHWVYLPHGLDGVMCTEHNGQLRVFLSPFFCVLCHVAWHLGSQPDPPQWPSCHFPLPVGNRIVKWQSLCFPSSCMFPFPHGFGACWVSQVWWLRNSITKVVVDYDCDSTLSQKNKEKNLNIWNYHLSSNAYIYQKIWDKKSRKTHLLLKEWKNTLHSNRYNTYFILFCFFLSVMGRTPIQLH